MKANQLKLKPLGIDTMNEHAIYMRYDCPVCISEGFEALTRVKISSGNRHIIGSLNVLINDVLLDHDEAGLSESAIEKLRAKPGDILTLSHLPPLESLSFMRAKIYGKKLKKEQIRSIVNDLAEGRYSNVQIAAFVTSCAGERMDVDEIVHLTRAMIDVGEKLNWPEKNVFDKHCIGGLPGNRTSPIVVSIVAAHGLTIPKTSSRAITSPAGTADVMETMTTVDLTMHQMKSVVEQEKGCMVWGGSMKLSPADDVLIRVERALDIDSEGQLIASVLSKKAAAGSTHVIIDIPVGPTAKVRSHEAALFLKERMIMVAEAINLRLDVIITDGTQPVGRGIGPALEAQDVLAVLRNATEAPDDLRNRALDLAAALLELSGEVAPGSGMTASKEILQSGDAFRKFMSICHAQGGFNEPRIGEFTYKIEAEVTGRVIAINNRKIARLAKLAGAPNDPGAGVLLHTPLQAEVKQGQPIMTVFAESEGELEYALEYYNEHRNMICIR